MSREAIEKKYVNTNCATSELESVEEAAERSERIRYTG